MSILSTNHRLIRVGQDYSAGENIGIQDHVISSKDWMSDIQAASANAYEAATAIIPEPQDLSYISAKVDDKLDSSSFVPNDFYPMTGNPSGFLTEHQDLSNYYTTGEANTLSSMFSGAIDYVSANAGDQEVSNVVQSNSANWNEVSSKQDKLTFKYGTTSGSISSINGSAIIDDYTYHMLNVTRVGLTNLTRNVSSNSGTWNEVSTTVQTNSAQWAGGDEEVTELVRSNSGEWNNVSSKLDESVFQETSGLFLTAIPQEYITENDIPNYISAKLDTDVFAGLSGYFLVASSLNGYATESFVETVSSDITAMIPDTSNFITNLSAEATYQTIEGMTAYQPTGAYITLNDFNYGVI